PNLYNDIPNFLHTIDVTYTAPAQPTLEAFRLVKARAIPVIRNVIVTPPEVANPTPAQRQVPIRVETNLDATNVAITFSLGAGTVALDSTTTNGSSKYWDFTWSNVAEGTYQIVSTVTAPAGTSTSTRNATVEFRQIVPTNGKDDKDDDGLGLYNPGAAPIETTAIPLPTTNSETWTNDQVHIWAISGKTDPLNPDSDGDDLSDGLELGWAAAVGDTSTTTDTNGDGVPNFQPDLD